MINYDDIFKIIYEELSSSNKLMIEIQLSAKNVIWQGENIVLSSGKTVSLKEYSDELKSDFSNLLSSLFKIMYNELSDSPNISYTIELKKNCLLEIIGLTVSLYKEMSKMELVIAATLLSSFVTGFLGLGFYRVKKETENVKYAADKEVEKAALELEKEKEKVKLAQLKIKERILNSSQKVYDLADKHKEKLSNDLNTQNIIASNIKINDYENNIKPEGLMPELEQKDFYSDQLENDDSLSPK